MVQKSKLFFFCCRRCFRCFCCWISRVDSDNHPSFHISYIFKKKKQFISINPGSKHHARSLLWLLRDSWLIIGTILDEAVFDAMEAVCTILAKADDGSDSKLSAKFGRKHTRLS